MDKIRFSQYRVEFLNYSKQGASNSIILFDGSINNSINLKKVTKIHKIGLQPARFYGNASSAFIPINIWSAEMALYRLGNKIAFPFIEDTENFVLSSEVPTIDFIYPIEADTIYLIDEFLVNINNPISITGIDNFYVNILFWFS